MKRYRWCAASLQNVSDQAAKGASHCTILQPNLEGAVVRGKPCSYRSEVVFSWETRSQHEQTIMPV